MSILKIRLKNCLRTILELEPELQKNGEDYFTPEFSRLKTYLQHVDEMDLVEDDVVRLENAASQFLTELRHAHYVYGARLVQ